MMPALNTIHLGDALTLLKTWPDAFVHCAITSPPYWGLRDYGTAKWEGGDPACDHAAAKEKSRCDYSLATSPIQQGDRTGTDAPRWKSQCPTCQAVKVDDQIGLEDTPEAYVARLVEVMREVKRVLRDDGTLWLNLGDSYCSTAPGTMGESNAFGGRARNPDQVKNFRHATPQGLKPKDLVGIPWRVAFALQADGWYLRSDIIWAKPNPMPESVTDRPTKAHEYLFLLAKAPRYYFDQEAVREHALPHVGKVLDNRTSGTGMARGHDGQADRQGNFEAGSAAGRNLRTVWTISTFPFADAHFATFPEKLIEPCILAGTSEYGVCGSCGAPWERIVIAEAPDGRRAELGKPGPDGKPLMGDNMIQAGVRGSFNSAGQVLKRETAGWRPTCDCPDGPPPARPIVLDPFMGAGTTALVAAKLNRQFVGCELSPSYLALANKRIADEVSQAKFF